MTAAKGIWTKFCAAHKISNTGTPLFDADRNGFVTTRLIGQKRQRSVLCRHPEMDALILAETDKLVADWRTGRHEYDGIIYMMYRLDDAETPVPLYVGKAETIGRGNGNLSVNISNLKNDMSKFARWGDNYAYHIGDLSAAVLPGHHPDKINPKYVQWASMLFVESPSPTPKLKSKVFFWAKAWKPSDVGIWADLSPTRLAFLEYLLIGVASTAFGEGLLNYEGRNRRK